MPDRSARRDVRNPVLLLEIMQEFLKLDPETKALLRQLLSQAEAHCRAKADKCWAQRKPPMAAYWAAWATNFRHLRLALK